MARGKNTCKILKEIRRQIAEANDIELATSECRYKGDCLGTCPKCEAEVRYLELQLRKRQLAGKLVNLAGISAGAIAMLTPIVVQARTPDAGSPMENVPAQMAADSIIAKGLEGIAGGVPPFQFDRKNMLDMRIIDENKKVIPYEKIMIERVYLDENGEEDSDYIDPYWIEEKGIFRFYWGDDPDFHDKDGKPLKEVVLRIEVDGYDNPETIKVKYPKRNTLKTVRFKY